MAEQQPQQGQPEPAPEANGSFYPPPPYFWESFTSENLTQLEELREEQVESQGTSKQVSTTTNLLNLPTELRFLQPPPPPTDGIWQCFGSTWNLKDELPTLQEMGTEQLYSPPASPSGTGKFTQHTDRAFVLKKIAKSLLLNFLELVGILGINPDQYQDKKDDLRTLFVNMHHLLNEYRPHQARESLIQMMSDQLERSKAETNGIYKIKKEVEDVLEGLEEAGLAEKDDIAMMDIGQTASDPTTTRMEGQDVWEELYREFS